MKSLLTLHAEILIFQKLLRGRARTTKMYENCKIIFFPNGKIVTFVNIDP